MKPHPRIRKTIKWGGAAVTVLLVVVSAGSWHYPMTRFGSDGFLCFGRGCVSLMWDDQYPSRPYGLGWKTSFFAGMNGVQPVLGFKYVRNSSFSFVSIPLWAPLVVVSVGVAAAWRLDTLARRRERAASLNLCPKCHYDRAGLVKDAVCPECGAASPSLPRSPASPS